MSEMINNGQLVSNEFITRERSGQDIRGADRLQMSCENMS